MTRIPYEQLEADAHVSLRRNGPLPSLVALAGCVVLAVSVFLPWFETDSSSVGTMDGFDTVAGLFALIVAVVIFLVTVVGLAADVRSKWIRHACSACGIGVVITSYRTISSSQDVLDQFGGTTGSGPIVTIVGGLLLIAAALGMALRD
jgi:hypothetical protein